MISIHALREEGDLAPFLKNNAQLISIHALREEGDEMCGDWKEITEISIHALREEGDMSNNSLYDESEHFNPRPPRGGRPDRTILL